MKYQATSFGEFRCGSCNNLVSVEHLFSGVNNRNHCPYCLWSRHLDLYSAGDRLSACKGQMKPIGLTMKRSWNKYRLESRGELMLIHHCVDCESLSINRIAADDDPDSIMEVFNDSLSLRHQIRVRCKEQEIALLNAEDMEIVYTQLYGYAAKLPEPSWA